MPGFDVKENYIHYRVREPSLFKEKSYITLNLKEGLKSRNGRLKTNNNWAIQSLLFDTKVYTLEQAKEYVRSHNSQFSIQINDDWINKYKKGVVSMNDFEFNVVELVTFAEWDSAYINSLPNDCFAYIEPNGTKHLPYKDKDGKVDSDHVRNALSRLNQVKCADGNSIPEDKQTKIKDMLQKLLGEEDKVEDKVESSMSDRDESTKKKLLQLNEELIEALKESNVEIDLQKKMLDKVNGNLLQLQDVINSYKKKEEDTKLAQFSTKVETTLKDYCYFFGIEDLNEVNKLREEMSKWSEGMIEKTRTLINQKKVETSNVPRSITEPSSNLREASNIESTGFRELSGKELSNLSAKEKTDYLYKKAIYYNK
jgi:phage shock protein A